MTQASYNTFYSNQYRSLYVGKETASKAFFEKQYKQGSKIFRYLRNRNNFNPKNMLALEVGCGAGGILKFFQDQGCEVIGLDLGETYLKYGRENHGLDLRVGALSSIQLERRPDLIIYSHVFEHILTPNEELKTIKSVLAETGLCYIEVPGLKYLMTSYNRDFLRYLQNAHVFHYTLTTISNLLRQNGFELCHGNEFIRLTAKKTPKQCSDAKAHIINDDADTLKYLNRLVKYRHVFKLFPYNWHRALVKNNSY